MAAVSLLAALVPAAEARAQGAPGASDAQALYDRAMVARDQGRYQVACPMLEEAAKLVPGSMAARIAVAECYLRWGRLATALSLYAAIEAEITAKGPAAPLAEVRARVEMMRATVAHLVLLVPPDVMRLPGLAIRLQGMPIDPAQVDAPIPVDRGSHQLEVTAAGRAPLARNIEILNDHKTYSVRVPMPSTVAPAEPPRTEPAIELPPLPRSSDPRNGPRNASVPGIVVLSAGVAALGIGTITGVVTLTETRAIKSSCQGDQCPPSQQQAGQRAGALATVSTAELIAGAAVAAVGVTLLVVRPFGRGNAAAGLRAGPGSVWVGGRF